jgi:lauroyl/myristoyl acyltransferase
VWALIIALDRLPWPLGEDLLAAMFAAVAVVKAKRRRRALAWAAHRPERATWRLALAASAFRGRWVARSALVGLRGGDDLRRHVVVQGEHHLAGHGGGTILLGFHLGPPNTDVALRVAGHRVAWLGHARHSPAWWRSPWAAMADPRESLSPPDGQRFWPGYLYRARRILLDGGAIYVKADAWKGRELCRVLVPGGTARIMAGWAMLARQTGARVLPVMTHLAGRDQVITIHPPLPRPAPGDAEDLEEWRAILAALITGYVERFPEQCAALAFPDERYIRDAEPAPVAGERSTR